MAPLARPTTFKAPERRQPVSPIRIPQRVLVGSTRQLAVLIKAGIPLVQSIKILSEQVEHAGLREAFRQVQRAIEGGSRFSDAIGRYPSVFPELFVSSIAAAEVGGALDQVLNRLATTLEKDHEIRVEVNTALRYPKMVVIAIVAAAIFMMLFVVPRFSSIYSRFGAALPLPTQVLIWGSQFLIHGWMIYLPAGAVLFFFLRGALGSRGGRYRWDRIQLAIPIFGPLSQKIVMSRFATMFCFLYSSGVHVVKALEVTARTVGNVAVGRQIGGVAAGVREGKSLAVGLEKAHYFTPLVRHMVAVGEVSGNLQEVLESVVAYYEIEVRHTIKNLTALIEPILIFVLGLVVLGLALAIFLPLWQMTQLFK